MASLVFGYWEAAKLAAHCLLSTLALVPVTIETRKASARRLGDTREVQTAVIDQISPAQGGGKLRRRIMKQLAQSLKSAVKWINAGSVVTRPMSRQADPANDNIGVEALRDYLQRTRSEAGMDYQPAGSKMWWLP